MKLLIKVPVLDKSSEGKEKAEPKGQEKKTGANAKPKGKTKPKDEKVKGKDGLWQGWKILQPWATTSVWLH